MRVADFDYRLPPELIAQEPIEPRDASRMLVLDRESNRIAHRHFNDLVSYLNPGDCLVVNKTKVIPARLKGIKKSTGARVEILFLRKVGEPETWEALVKPGKSLPVNSELVFAEGMIRARVIGVTDFGGRVVEVAASGSLVEELFKWGEAPLPPYIRKEIPDQSRYQTIYAEDLGSAAAPTAGLHFTPGLYQRLAAKGILISKITLHVGLGTFRPVKVANVEEHRMHQEYYKISPEAADIINKTKLAGHKVVAVGTTAVRSLEASAASSGLVYATHGWTDIFIYPGFRFQVIDALVTNFHLPKSTLLMLVSAFAGREAVLAAYREAVAREYRFFSFGDAMLIL